jgi:catechol 2,3-dioxygenase-like lactoylglutathione lyase family enzyme
MSSKLRFGFVLEYVTDIDAVKRFYVDVLGLEVEREAPVFVQFKDQAGTSYAIASDASTGGGTDPEVYWLTEDAEAAYAELSRQAPVSVPLSQKPFGKVFGIEDPAGQAAYIVELAANRPSRPTGQGSPAA